MRALLSICNLGENGSLMPSLQGHCIALVQSLGQLLPWLPVKWTLNILEHRPLIDLLQPVRLFSPFELLLQLKSRVVHVEVKILLAVVVRFRPFLMTLNRPAMFKQIALQGSHRSLGYLPRVLGLLQPGVVNMPCSLQILPKMFRPVAIEAPVGLDLIHEGTIIWLLMTTVHVIDDVQIACPLVPKVPAQVARMRRRSCGAKPMASFPQLMPDKILPL